MGNLIIKSDHCGNSLALSGKVEEGRDRERGRGEERVQGSKGKLGYHTKTINLKEEKSIPPLEENVRTGN